MTQKVIELDEAHNLAAIIRVPLCVDDCRIEESLTYNELLAYIQRDEAEEMAGDRDFKLRPITSHEGLHTSSHPS